MNASTKNHPTVLIHTLGCKVNQYDSERLRTLLRKQGCRTYVNSNAASPDLIVINTCSVTAESDRKGRQLIRKLIRQHPHARVVVTGCYSERKPDLLAKIPGVDEIVPIEEQERWAERLPETLGWEIRPDTLWESTVGIDAFQEHTRAFVKIQDGCDLRCTFCSIPYSRGQSRSRPIPEIIEECRNLVYNGYPEIVLCGVCIGQYGKGEDFDVPQLIDEIAPIEGLARLRISSYEPQDLSNELLDTMARWNKIVCPHLHLPLQSGSNRILRRMKRPYTFEFFHEWVEQARQTLPNFEVTTDIMTGFPGEMTTDFELSLEAVRLCRFTKVHSFRFSVREGVPAARMKDKLPPSIIEERRRELDRLAAKTAEEVKQSYIGHILPVLVETIEDDRATGFTSNYLRAVFSPPKNIKQKDIVIVRINRVEKGELIGTLDS